mmetsp:Transcript_28585/g.60329  ORF Transcript_28585/g.60329 Transcript_28585/m.60329 type:complete len:422 (-) Transcript_28585:140-1405(-)
MMTSKTPRFPLLSLLFVITYLQLRGAKYHVAMLKAIQYAKVFDSQPWEKDTKLNNTTLPSSPASRSDDEFVKKFSRALMSDSLSEGDVVPFIVQRGKLLCRRSHKRQIGKSLRSRRFVEMVSNGLKSKKYKNPSYRRKSGLPILLLSGDGNGCDITKQVDQLKYPRLTWSIPSPKHGENWCHAIPTPSYSMLDYNRTHRMWQTIFASQSETYPWSSKINKAVWRGSTTYSGQFFGADLNDTPRGRLVQESMQNPELIDAGFTSIVQQYESQKEALLNQTILTERIAFDDQMKHKAILDIDGNTWSSRFPKLLCTNSVVIKIDPDYAEHFYHELKPMTHYVPASLQNITEVVAFVLNPDNENKIRAIVESANLWCKATMNRHQIVKDTMVQLEKYGAAVHETIEDGSLQIPNEVLKKMVKCY